MNGDRRDMALIMGSPRFHPRSGMTDPNTLVESSAACPKTQVWTEEFVIEPSRRERHYWQDLWRYRELFFVLAWRDVSVRYKQTVIGFAWAFVRPFMTMVVFTVVFG